MPIDSRDKKKALYEIADRQSGYFTAKQARGVGYYNRLQHYHKEKGDWHLIERGIYRLRDYPSSDREDLVRWSLWSFNRQGEPQAVFSHDTALAFHQIGDFMPAKTHITVPPTFRKKIQGGCVVHKALLPPGDAKSYSGLKVTTPLRSLFDAYTAHAEPDRLERAIRDAFKRGLVRLDEFESSSSRSEMGEFLSFARSIRNKVVHGVDSDA